MHNIFEYTKQLLQISCQYHNLLKMLNLKWIS